jgi:cytidylate kinase
MANIISITGDLGSGKSTVSAILCKCLKYDYIYTGEIQRRIANRYNMTTTELNKYSETHPEIDEEIDSTFKSLNNSENLIVDSRLAWFFIPNSFKVFLKTNLMISAERISGDTKRKSENYETKEEAVYNITSRKTSENKRYSELYGANCSDLSNFNLIIDTSFVTPDKVAEIIIREYESWLISEKDTIALISPKNLYPTQFVCDFNNDRFQTVLNSMNVNGYDSNFPVTVVGIGLHDYIFDGHKRTSSAIQNNIDLIPVVYKDENSSFTKDLTYKEKIQNSKRPTHFYDWEDFNSFNFLVYPVK